MTSEEEFLAKAEQTTLKLKALNWLNAKAASIPTGHAMTCNAEDDTGWPAPCSCGFDKNEEVKIVRLLKKALLKE